MNDDFNGETSNYDKVIRLEQIQPNGGNNPNAESMALDIRKEIRSN